MNTKIKTKKDLNELILMLRESLNEIDCLMDDYFEYEKNDCGMKWFSFNEEKRRANNELIRVSVWSLDGNCFDVEEMLASKYVWLGDLVLKIDNKGKLIFENQENRSGLIADDLMELFRGFCGGKIACVMPNNVDVRVRVNN